MIFFINLGLYYATEHFQQIVFLKMVGIFYLCVIIFYQRIRKLLQGIYLILSF